MKQAKYIGYISDSVATVPIPFFISLPPVRSSYFCASSNIYFMTKAASASSIARSAPDVDARAISAVDANGHHPESSIDETDGA